MNFLKTDAATVPLPNMQFPEGQKSNEARDFRPRASSGLPGRVLLSRTATVQYHRRWRA